MMVMLKNTYKTDQRLDCRPTDLVHLYIILIRILLILSQVESLPLLYFVSSPQWLGILLPFTTLVLRGQCPAAAQRGYDIYISVIETQWTLSLL